ncbi:hypothetical protein [Streptomyces griseoruber]|uniref:hypothetical protein n=1 Tax=Streptomyces griseoruber TaxID=1943 RepID=UPI003792769D
MTAAQALHRNHEAFWRHKARVSDGTAEEIPGGLLVTTGITMTPYNQIHWRTGATTAVLQATPAGYALYRRMGFEHIGDYHIWDLPTTAESGSHVG